MENTLSRIIFFCALLILPSSATGTSSTTLLNPDYLEGGGSTSLSFDSADDLIIIKATINGKGPFRLLLDTGASTHLMTPDLAQLLRLRVEDNGVIDAGGRTKVSAGSVQVAEVRVGDFTLEKQRFAVAPLPASYTFQGFIGAEFFKHFIVRIDFRQSLLTLTVPNTFRYDGTGVSLPIKFHQGLIPQVKARVDDVLGWFKLDTGYNGSLALFGGFIDEHHLFSKYAPKRSDTGVRTVTEETRDVPVAQIQKFQLGELKVGGVVTSFFLEREGSNSIFAGAIGTGILKQFNVIINYAKQRLMLESR